MFPGRALSCVLFSAVLAGGAATASLTHTTGTTLVSSQPGANPFVGNSSPRPLTALPAVFGKVVGGSTTLVPTTIGSAPVSSTTAAPHVTTAPGSTAAPTTRPAPTQPPPTQPPRDCITNAISVNGTQYTGSGSSTAKQFSVTAPASGSITVTVSGEGTPPACTYHVQVSMSGSGPNGTESAYNCKPAPGFTSGPWGVHPGDQLSIRVEEANC